MQDYLQGPQDDAGFCDVECKKDNSIVARQPFAVFQTSGARTVGLVAVEYTHITTQALRAHWHRTRRFTG